MNSEFSSLEKRALTYFLFTFLRFLKVACNCPKAALICILVAAQKIPGFSLIEEAAEEFNRNKVEKILRKQTKGSIEGFQKYTLKFFGLKVFSIESDDDEVTNAVKFFFLSQPRKVFKRVASFLEKMDLQLNISPGAFVLEPGCNAGRMLYFLREHYGCEVMGLDVNVGAIKIAQEAALSKSEKFHVQNVLSPTYFDQFEDGHFEVCFICSHVVHVTHFGESFWSYWENLKRVSKTVIVYDKNTPTFRAFAERACDLKWDLSNPDFGVGFLSKNSIVEVSERSDRQLKSL